MERLRAVPQIDVPFHHVIWVPFMSDEGIKGYSIGRNRDEAVTNYLKQHGNDGFSEEHNRRHWKAERIRVPNFKITLTPLEQKVFSGALPYDTPTGMFAPSESRDRRTI